MEANDKSTLHAFSTPYQLLYVSFVQIYTLISKSQRKEIKTLRVFEKHLHLLYGVG